MELRAEAADGLAHGRHTVLDLVSRPVAPEPLVANRAVIETALADVQAKKSAWTAPDLTRAISDTLPADTSRPSRPS